MKTKRILTLLSALSLLLSLTACGGTAATPTVPPTGTPASAAPTAAPAPEATQTPETREFTDSTGRTVTVPYEITKIAVSGPMSQIFLFALAPDMLVGISNDWDPGAEDYFDARYFNLPKLGQLYGGKGEMNLEELLAADPDVVIDVGEPKGSIREDMDALTEQTGIPFVHIDTHTATMGEAYHTAGELLGLQAEAAVLADYCDEVYSNAQKLIERIGVDKKVRLLYLLGDTGLNVIAKDSYHAEIIDMMADNLAVVDNPSSKGTGNETDMEQLLLWDPDYILFAPGSIADTVGDEAAWQQLKAIRNGNYAEVPFGPYNWMGFPPSVQRYLGILWMTETLYPEQADIDLFSEVSRYFELFYHCTLTQEAYDAIVG